MLLEVEDRRRWFLPAAVVAAALGLLVACAGDDQGEILALGERCLAAPAMEGAAPGTVPPEAPVAPQEPTGGPSASGAGGVESTDVVPLFSPFAGSSPGSYSRDCDLLDNPYGNCL